MPAIPEVGFRSPEMGAGIMTLLLKFINSSSIGTAVVRCEDHERGFTKPRVIDRLNDITNNGVRLHDKVTILAKWALTLPFFGRQDGCVW